MLDDACWHLQCSYNYQIVGKPTPEQVASRTKIGEIATTVLDPIADDLILTGIRTYLEYLGYSQVDALKILKVEKLSSEVMQDDILDILRALNLGDYARPVSPHQVVQDEIIPTIRRLNAKQIL